MHDRDVEPATAERERWAALVNERPRCQACLTHGRSLENYLHPQAILEARGLTLEFASDDDVAELMARVQFQPSIDASDWNALSRRSRRRRRERAKTWLNTMAVDRMTPERLTAIDPGGDVVGWLGKIADLLRL